MIVDIVAQFMQELIRALLIDALSSRVRRRARILLVGRAESSTRRALRRVHQHNRKRILNRLATEADEGS